MRGTIYGVREQCAECDAHVIDAGSGGVGPYTTDKWGGGLTVGLISVTIRAVTRGFLALTESDTLLR
jgi:hypothetical protein